MPFQINLSSDICNHHTERRAQQRLILHCSFAFGPSSGGGGPSHSLAIIFTPIPAPTGPWLPLTDSIGNIAGKSFPSVFPHPPFWVWQVLFLFHPFFTAAQAHRVLIILVYLFLTAGLTAGLAAADQEAPTETYPGPSHYIRFGYQIGSVFQSDQFLKGMNRAGEPIDSFQSLHLDYGWQTDGSKEWNHAFNFPSFGLGIYAADYGNKEELGSPYSAYGFFVWPVHRGEKWRINLEIAFGVSAGWEYYDPVTNPDNVTMGQEINMHIESAANAEYLLSKRWSIIGGITSNHLSNGGTKRPNYGVNQFGPILYVKYATDNPTPVPPRRHDLPYDRGWNLTLTGSGGQRNLDLLIVEPDQTWYYVNRSYFIGNLSAGLGRQFSYKSRYVFGLDLGYDTSAEALTKNDAENQGQTADPSPWDNLELSLFAGYEFIAHRTSLQLHLGYTILRADIPNQVPRYFQRLAIKQFAYKGWFVGMGVRFQELGAADNLELTIGCQIKM